MKINERLMQTIAEQGALFREKFYTSSDLCGTGIENIEALANGMSVEIAFLMTRRDRLFDDFYTNNSKFQMAVFEHLEFIHGLDMKGHQKVID